MYEMRKPCGKCGSTSGRIEPKGAQDCVYCDCGAFQYNAPREETGKPVRSVNRKREPFKPSVRAAVLMRASGRCELCGAKPGPEGEIHVGHLLSIDDGLRAGIAEAVLNDVENLAAMCDQCNLGIGATTVPLRLAIAMVLARTAT